MNYEMLDSAWNDLTPEEQEQCKEAHKKEITLRKNINVEEILKKNLGFYIQDIAKSFQLKTAIKEIVESVIDQCAENARIKYPLRDDNEINKQSILNVKTLITY